MDCQTYDLNYQAATSVFGTQTNKMDSLITADSTAPWAIEMARAYKKFNAIQKQDRDLEKSSVYFTEWLNTDEAALMAFSADHLLPEMYDIPNFPKQAGLAVQHWWQKRNEGMCQNTIEGAAKAGVHRVVVIAGASHRKTMEDIFKKMPNVHVQNINDFK